MYTINGKSYNHTSFGFLNEDKLVPAPCTLMDFGIERRINENYYFDNEQRTNFEGVIFQYTLSGKGYFEYKNEITELTEGRGFLVMLPHASKYYIREEDGWEFFYIHFNGSVAQQVAKTIIENKGNVLDFFEEPEFLKIFLEEFEAVKSGKKYESYEASVFLYHFLMLLLKESEARADAELSIVSRGREWMDLHYKNGCRVTEICEELKVSAAHFSRQFHAAYGTTPLSYLNRLRIEYAITLLLSSSGTIKEISEK